MKKNILSTLVLTMILSLIAFMPALAESKAIVFDDLSSFNDGTDFEYGGGLSADNITLSSEYDHTTGSGKSLKLSGLKNNYDRIKLPVFTTLNETYNVSIWVYTLQDAKIQLGGIGKRGTSTTGTFTKEVQYDVKANVWTNITYQYKYENADYPLLAIEQTKNADIVDTIYIDDIDVQEVKPDITITETISASYDDGKGTDTKTMRFFAPINSLEYATAGFEVNTTVEEQTYSWTIELNEVYSEVKINDQTYVANEGEYILTGAIGDIPSSVIDTLTFSVKPYTVDLQNNTVYGNVVTID